MVYFSSPENFDERDPAVKAMLMKPEQRGGDLEAAGGVAGPQPTSS
jgi:hypothetical protein